MKSVVEHELQTRWFWVATEGLVNVKGMMERRSRKLIHRAFEDDQGGKCVAEWFGVAMGISGPEFLRRSGLPLVSEVVYAWDTDPRFPQQLLTAIRREIFFRKGVRRAKKRKAVGGEAPRRAVVVPAHS